MLSNIFHFCQDSEITIFANFFKNVAKFFKYSIYMADIFVKLSCEIWTKFGAAILGISTALGQYYI